MTEIYLHIVARMADYMATHPYSCATGVCGDASNGGCPRSDCPTHLLACPSALLLPSFPSPPTVSVVVVVAVAAEVAATEAVAAAS